MYQIKKNSNVIVEELEIENEKGEKTVFKVNVSFDKIAKKYHQLRAMMSSYEKEIEKSESDEWFEKYVEVFVELMRLFFGDEEAKRLIEYYDGNYTDVLLDIAPFIVEVVQPKVNQRMSEKAQKYIDNSNV